MKYHGVGTKAWNIRNLLPREGRKYGAGLVVFSVRTPRFLKGNNAPFEKTTYSYQEHTTNRLLPSFLPWGEDAHQKEAMRILFRYSFLVFNDFTFSHTIEWIPF